MLITPFMLGQGTGNGYSLHGKTAFSGLRVSLIGYLLPRASLS